MWFEELHWAILMPSEYCANGMAGMRAQHTTRTVSYLTVRRVSVITERQRVVVLKERSRFLERWSAFVKQKLPLITLFLITQPKSHVGYSRKTSVLFLCPLSCCLCVWLYSRVLFLTPNQINSVLWHTPAISQVSLLQSFPPSGSFVCL